MAFEDLLDKKANIYHPIGNKQQTVGGVLIEGETMYDMETPDSTDVLCYISKPEATLVQTEPHNEMIQTVTIFMLPEEDIRDNSRIVVEGKTYQVIDSYLPRGHHLEIKARMNLKL